MPSGIVPLTVVQPEEDVYEDGISDIISKVAKQTEQGSVGLPVGVSVTAFAYRDEVALRVMRLIENEAKF